jgi:wobble nucleotide-excising tRNase
VAAISFVAPRCLTLAEKTAVGNVKRSKEIPYLTTCTEAAEPRLNYSYERRVTDYKRIKLGEQRAVHLHNVRRRFDEYFSIVSISNVTS